MSIALFAVLHPSKSLRSCAIVFALFLLFIGTYIATLKTVPVVNQTVFIALCCFAAWRSFLYSQKIAQTSWRIYITGQGQLQVDNKSFNVMSGTTLWAHALFLRLHNPEENLRMNLVVLFDGLSKDEFRRLALACKWIVAHAEDAVEKGLEGSQNGRVD